MAEYILNKKIGIIGGGQLGKMMIQEAKKMGFYITVLDPTLNCPAHNLVNDHIVADFDDEKAIFSLASKSDIITYEFEHIGINALEKLELKGYKVYPTIKSLKIIQNKYDQKTILKQNNIPVPDFIKVENLDDIREATKRFGYPVILKTCTGGYDGKGNALISNKDDIEAAYIKLGNGKLQLMVEEFVDFAMETSVLACRGTNGDTVVYPMGENIHYDNILFETRVPANVNNQITKVALKLAEKVMNIFEGVGMFCVEMFITRKGEVFVNEIAPRPHNSGHYSIEGCVTSQFEQHIRAITELPLGDTSLIRPTVMVNLLGEEGYKGKAIVIGASEALAIQGVKLHIYGKELVAPKRKMGHLTVTSETLENAIYKIEKAKSFIKIIGEQKI